MENQKTHICIEVTLLAVLAFLWGSSYLFIKIAVITIPPVTLIAIRVTIASLFLLVFLVWRGVRLPKDGRSWGMLFVQAIFNSIGAWTVLAWGQQYVGSGLASVLNSTSPIFVFIITQFITKHEHVSHLKLVGVCLGIIGVTLIVGIDAMNGIGLQILAQCAILFGAMLYAGAAIYGKQLSYLPPIVSAAGTMIWATIFLVPTSILIDRPWLLSPSVKSIFAAILLGVFCTGFALLIYFRLVLSLGSIGVASQSYLRAGVGVILGVAILNEQITLSIGIGLIAVILGVVAINVPASIGKKLFYFKEVKKSFHVGNSHR